MGAYVKCLTWSQKCEVKAVASTIVDSITCVCTIVTRANSGDVIYAGVISIHTASKFLPSGGPGEVDSRICPNVTNEGAFLTNVSSKLLGLVLIPPRSVYKVRDIHQINFKIFELEISHSIIQHFVFSLDIISTKIKYYSQRNQITPPF